MGTLKQQNNGPLYNNTVIGTLAVDGYRLLHLVQWAVSWGGCSPAQSSPRCTKCNSSRPVYQLHIIQRGHISIKGYDDEFFNCDSVGPLSPRRHFLQVVDVHNNTHVPTLLNSINFAPPQPWPQLRCSSPAYLTCVIDRNLSPSLVESVLPETRTICRPYVSLTQQSYVSLRTWTIVLESIEVRTNITVVYIYIFIRQVTAK